MGRARRITSAFPINPSVVRCKRFVNSARTANGMSETNKNRRCIQQERNSPDSTSFSYQQGAGRDCQYQEFGVMWPVVEWQH